MHFRLYLRKTSSSFHRFPVGCISCVMLSISSDLNLYFVCILGFVSHIYTYKLCICSASQFQRTDYLYVINVLQNEPSASSLTEVF